MKFIVEEKTWKNPNIGEGDPCLLNKKGYRCCLGFCMSQLGNSDDTLLDANYPWSEVKANKELKIKDPSNIFISETNKHTELSYKAANINDDGNIGLEERKKRLKTLFMSYGHEIEFV